MKWGLLILFSLLLAACSGPASHPGMPDDKTGLGAFPPAPSEGGGSSDVGSAGDNIGPDHGAAWFVGQARHIDVCYEVAQDFGYDEKKAGKLIKAIFMTWRDYIKDHKVYELEWPNLQLATEHVSVRLGCSGPRPDLAIYLGVENDDVKKYRGQFIKPTAFVQRLSFEKLPPWGKGFIWVAKQGGIRAAPVFPDWSKLGALSGILLHEVGHTYGNDHIPGTIMAADISDLLRTEDFTTFVNIDRCRELAPCLNCFYVHPFEAGGLDQPAVMAASKLLERPPSGKGGMILARTTTTSWGLLSFEDEKGSAQFRLESEEEITAPQVSGLSVFKVAYGDYVNSIPDVSFTQHGPVYNEAGKKAGFAVIESNLASCTGDDQSGGVPVKISLVENEQWLPLAAFPTQIDPIAGKAFLLPQPIPSLPPRF